MRRSGCHKNVEALERVHKPGSCLDSSISYKKRLDKPGIVFSVAEMEERPIEVHKITRRNRVVFFRGWKC